MPDSTMNSIGMLCLTFDFQDAAAVPDPEWNA
jgi:hypothetical protein